MALNPQILDLTENENNKLISESFVSMCFATFDDAIGPLSVYHRFLEDNLANEIAIKVMIGTLSISSDNNNELCGESIIPFGKLNKIAFSYFFTIAAPKLRGGQRSCSLIVLMDANEQLQMYRLAPFLSSQCKKVSEAIKEKYIFGKPIPVIIKQKLDSLLDVKSYKVEIEEFYASRKITITKSKTKGSLQFLNKVITKDLDKAVLSLLLGKTIVVTGDEVMTELAIASLELFAPHKELKKVFWTNQIVEADIIGTPKNVAKAYENAIIVDLLKGKVIGGESSKFCKDLLYSLRDLDETTALQKVNDKVSEIITSASILAELAMRKEVTKGDISTVAPMFNSEKMSIIITIAKSMNPLFSKKIDYLAPIITREASTYDVFA